MECAHHLNLGFGAYKSRDGSCVLWVCRAHSTMKTKEEALIRNAEENNIKQKLEQDMKGTIRILKEP